MRSRALTSFILLTIVQSLFSHTLPPTSQGGYFDGIRQSGRTVIYSGKQNELGAGSFDNDNQNGGLTEKWIWDFDYKNSTFTEDAVTSSYLVSHIYDQSGTYTVAVIYFDDDGQQGNTYTFSIIIGDGGSATFEIQPMIVSQSNYFLSNEAHVDFTLTDPNFVTGITYTDEKGFADVSGSDGWTYGGDVTFGMLLDAVPTIRIGGPAWSSLSKSTGDGNVIARVDFYPDNATGGTPHVLAFEGSGYRFCVQYNPGADKFQIQTKYPSTNYVVASTFDLEAPPNQWYTVEIEKGIDGKCVAWVYRQGNSRNYADMYSTIGFLSSWNCNSISYSDYDYFYLTNYYVGSYSQSTAYSGGLGRTLQSQTRDGLKDIVSAINYDSVNGRQNKTYRPYSYTTGHLYDTSFVSNVSSAYPLAANPYSEIEYYADPLNRVKYSKPAGSSNINEWMESRFGKASVNGVDHFYTESVQQIGTNIPHRTIARQYMDKLGRVVKTENYEDETSAKITSTAVYNMQGNITTAIDPMGYVTTNVYNFLGRKTSETTVDAGTSQFKYSTDGNLRFMVDAVGDAASGNDKILYWKYDQYGRVKEKGYIIDRAWEGITSTEISDTSFPVGSVCQNTWRKRYYYDGSDVMLFTKGRLVKVSTNNDDDASVEVEEAFEYDKEGNVLAVSLKAIDFDANTYTTYYSYDHLNRVINVQYPSNPSDTQLQSITVISPNIYTSSSVGTITAGPSFTVQLGGIATLQAAKSIKLVPGFKAASGSRFSAKINSVVAELMVVKYSYNQLGQLIAIGNGNDTDYYAAYSYNADGSINQERLNNSTSVKSFQYAHRLGYLTGTTHLEFNESFNYTENGYNNAGYNNGSIAKVTYSYRTSVPSGYNYTFQYDKYNRMTVADNSSNNLYDIGVGSPTVYDDNGKIFSRKMGTSTAQNFQYYNGKNWLLSTGDHPDTYQFELTGNMTENPKKQLAASYDPFTMMTKNITDNDESVDFQYDSKKERLLKTVTPVVTGTKTTTMYLRGLSDYPIVTKIGNSSIHYDKFYIYGPTGLVATQNGTTTFFVLKDHLGSTRVVLNSSNTPQSWLDYTPYGKVWRATMSPDIAYKFTGQEFDTELDLHNFRARMYDDDLWMFYAIDPENQTYSPFAYAGNNPIIYIDPTGRIDKEWWEKIAKSKDSYSIIAYRHYFEFNDSPLSIGKNGAFVNVYGYLKYFSAGYYVNKDDEHSLFMPVPRWITKTYFIKTIWAPNETERITTDISNVRSQFRKARKNLPEIGFNPAYRTIQRYSYFNENVKTNSPLVDIKNNKNKPLPEVFIYNGGIFEKDNIGNLYYGIAAKEFGVPFEIAKKAAGVAQIKDYLTRTTLAPPDLSNFDGFFDRSEDTPYIIMGFNLKER